MEPKRWPLTQPVFRRYLTWIFPSAGYPWEGGPLDQVLHVRQCPVLGHHSYFEGHQLEPRCHYYRPCSWYYCFLNFIETSLTITNYFSCAAVLHQDDQNVPHWTDWWSVCICTHTDCLILYKIVVLYHLVTGSGNLYSINQNIRWAD